MGFITYTTKFKVKLPEGQPVQNSFTTDNQEYPPIVSVQMIDEENAVVTVTYIRRT